MHSLLPPPPLQAFDVAVTHKVRLTISIANETAGDVTIGLFGDITPRTVDNFVTLASAEGYAGKSYRGSLFHRIIPSFMVQAGDITSRDGRGSFSIYGEKFSDENFVINHGEPGLVSMANAGPDTNGSQFFITLVPTPWLDGHHTVFGKVLDGMDLVHRLGSLPTDGEDRPKEEVVIVDTEVTKLAEPETIVLQ